jgi:hypothetical protein
MAHRCTSSSRLASSSRTTSTHRMLPPAIIAHRIGNVPGGSKSLRPFSKETRVEGPPTPLGPAPGQVISAPLAWLACSLAGTRRTKGQHRYVTLTARAAVHSNRLSLRPDVDVAFIGADRHREHQCPAGTPSVLLQVLPTRCPPLGGVSAPPPAAGSSRKRNLIAAPRR